MYLRIFGLALAVAGPLASAVSASADPLPPPPAPPSIVDAIQGSLAQSGAPGSGIVGLPDLSAYQNQILLGQTATPALPGTDPGTPTHQNALNNAYLLPQNEIPAAPGQGRIDGVEPGAESADINRRELLSRLWGMYQQGDLEGALLGQQPPPPPAG